MTWDIALIQFKNYLKLERSLSENSIEAYERDVVKLKQFGELSNIEDDPASIELKDLHSFLEYVTKLGLSAHSQARIISGIKAFYKFLNYEDHLTSDPTELLESPKIGQKTPRHPDL